MDAREILKVLLRKPYQINKTLPRPLLKRYEIDHPNDCKPDAGSFRSIEEAVIKSKLGLDLGARPIAEDRRK